ncbi:unnamed protein product [Rotaria sp. Silwood2]|nr:unnamed protein product [Rotaria sp. Silwood2]CAF2810638.1 unnamed protein product [Rotaria sp. Silwood2]CAF3193867.1 unnamed protein product [Rotaria sp. Silwood2]CAF3874144.1 unnamed protein product [Rotaria sp. Silwood2]CAF4281531.1 unnamed protein product [Rotaria sp. Silwood2]
MEISNVIDFQLITDAAQMFFDPRIHAIDHRAQSILETSTAIVTSIAKAIEVIGDGDCGFHSFQVFYPSMSQLYNSLASQHGFDLVDDETVQEHALRILDNGEYAGILTLSALASVFERVVDSVYPTINDNDPYTNLLNTNFQPRPASLAINDDYRAFHLRILWSGPEATVGHDWRPNHFVPLLYTKCVADNTVQENDSSTHEITEKSSLLAVNQNSRKVTTQTKRDEIDTTESSITFRSSDLLIRFLGTTDIIKRIIYSNQSNILDIPRRWYPNLPSISSEIPRITGVQ